MLKPPAAAVNDRNELGESMQQRLPVMQALAVVIGLGLASRAYDGLFPNALGKYPGDALWTVAVYLGWKLVFPAMVPWKLGLMALGQSVGSSSCNYTTRPGWTASEATTSGICSLDPRSTQWILWRIRWGPPPCSSATSYWGHAVRCRCVGLDAGHGDPEPASK